MTKQYTDVIFQKIKLYIEGFKSLHFYLDQLRDRRLALGLNNCASSGRSHGYCQVLLA